MNTRQPVKKIFFRCLNCQSKYSAFTEQAGEVGICGKCGAQIIVPKQRSISSKQKVEQDSTKAKKVDQAGVSKNNPYFSFAGRIPRKEFWFYPIISIMANITLITFTAVGNEILQDFAISLFILVNFLSPIILSFPIVKRLHDLNLSGWFWWTMVIPIINLVFLLILIAKRGVSGENKYGLDPLT